MGEPKQPLEMPDDPAVTAHYAARGWAKFLRQRYVMPLPPQRDENGALLVQLSNDTVVRLPGLRASR